MDYATFITDQVAKSGRLHFNKGDHVTVQCPIHGGGGERTPSRKINISNPRYKPLESFCFACHKDEQIKSWNELAAVMNMAPIREAEESDGEEDELWVKLPPPEDFYGMEAENVAQFQWEGKWRGISTKLLKRLNASMVNSRDEPRIYFPIYVDGVEVGNTQCVVDAKHEEASKIKYLHSGKWTNWTMYPVDIAFPMAEKMGFLLIVEGLRDALRLIDNGVPAVCIWGTNGWNKAKREILMELEGVKLVVAMDGDEAGWKARDEIEADCKRLKMSHAVINFKEGMDPGGLKRSEIQEIAQMFGPKWRSILTPRALNDNFVVQALVNLFYKRRAG